MKLSCHLFFVPLSAVLFLGIVAPAGHAQQAAARADGTLLVGAPHFIDFEVASFRPSQLVHRSNSPPYLHAATLSTFSAVKQPGLEIISTKGQRDGMGIDHLERPPSD